MKPESPSAINLNKKSTDKKPILALFPIWRLITHKTQDIFPIRNIVRAFLTLLTLKRK